MALGDGSEDGSPRPFGRAGSPAEGRELRARGQRTVRRLLDAGIAVFGEKGYHLARVDDIVAAAQTSHGTFYLYYASKEDLFRSLTLEVADELDSLVGDMAPFTADAAGYARFREWLGRFADLHRRYAPVIKAWTEADSGDMLFGDVGAAALGSFATALARELADAEATEHPGAAALALVAMIERFHYYAMVGQVRDAEESVLDTLATVTYTAIFGPLR